MELYAENLHFLGCNARERKFDLCAHGDVFLKLDGKVLFRDTDTCVSASALRFLHSIFTDHISGNDEQMFPCCGHMMIPSEDGTSVTIVGCPNGIDFDVMHNGDGVILTGGDGQHHFVTSREYIDAVLSYAGQIESFYSGSPPRRFSSDFDREGFTAFCREFQGLLANAQSKRK